MVSQPVDGIGEQGAVLLSKVIQCLPVENRYFFAAGHHHGLEFFGTKNGTKAGASRGPASVVHNGREPDHILPGLSDAEHLYPAAQFRLEDIFGLVTILAPKMSRVAQFGAPVVDKKVYRFLGLTCHKDGVIAGEFQVGAEITAGIGIPPAVGQGGFAHQRIA